MKIIIDKTNNTSESLATGELNVTVTTETPAEWEALFLLALSRRSQKDASAPLVVMQPERAALSRSLRSADSLLSDPESGLITLLDSVIRGVTTMIDNDLILDAARSGLTLMALTSARAKAGELSALTLEAMHLTRASPATAETGQPTAEEEGKA